MTMLIFYRIALHEMQERINMFSKARWGWFFVGSVIISLFLSGYAQGTSSSERNAGVLSQASFEGVMAYVELDGEIYLRIGETDERIQLTNDADQHQYKNPQFSPDGSHLAYLKTDPNKGETLFDLHVMNLADRTTQMLVEDVENYDWEPGGQSIAVGFSMDLNCQSPDEDTARGIWKVSLATGQLEEILPASANNPKDAPVFSFDGQWLSYQEYPCFSSGFNTHVWNLDSHEDINLGMGDLSWVPNDNLLTWSEDTSWSGGEIAGVMMRSPDQQNNQLIYQDNQMTALASVWSPDMNWIAVVLGTPIESGGFFDPSEMEHRLVLVRPDGSQPREISSDLDFGFRLIWSPNSEQIVFTTGNQVRPDWNLYSLETQEIISLPDFGAGGLDWINAIDLPQPNPTEIKPTEPELAASNSEIVATQSVAIESAAQAPIKSSKSNALLLAFGGIGLILISGVILLLVLKSARK